MCNQNLPADIVDTVKRYIADGMTVIEAIEQVESVINSTLPEHIKDMIKREV